jgi:hypothetical protein
MKTTKLWEIIKFPSINTNNEIWSKDVLTALKWFNNRLTKLPENPFAEYWNKAINILDMKDTTKEEETWMQVWQMFWHSLTKMWEMVQIDRWNNQIEKMLAPFWITTSDNYNLKKVATA